MKSMKIEYEFVQIHFVMISKCGRKQLNERETMEKAFMKALVKDLWFHAQC